MFEIVFKLISYGLICPVISYVVKTLIQTFIQNK